MPNSNLKSLNFDNTYYHVYNKRADDKLLFKNNSDYDTFLDFLKQYLSPPPDKDSSTTTFVIRGREYKGTPRQLKNYYERVELVAYNLSPDHFHLVFRELTPGSLKSFLSSFSTRYSIYFNKKYKRSGSLFNTSYKSAKIEDLSCLAYLTRYIHAHYLTTGNGNDEKYSSYPDYLGKRSTPWLNTQEVLSLFSKSGTKPFKNLSSYRNFVEKYIPKEQDIKSLEKVAIENINLAESVNENEVEIEEPEFIDSKSDYEFNPISKVTQIIIASIVFVSLFILGVRNIQTTLTKNLICGTSPTPVAQDILGTTTQTTESEIPSVISENIAESTESVTPDIILEEVVESTESETPQNSLLIKISEGYDAVNIRKSPALDSELISLTKAGDTFEYVSLNSGWSGVKLEDGSIGYISADYVELIGGLKQ